MRRYGYALLGLVIIAGTMFVTSDQIAGNDFKIMPGDRIGDVSLTMSFDDIVKLLGSPSRVDRVSSSQTMYEWGGHQIRLYQLLDTGRVNDIRTYWLFRRPSAYRTDKGIGVGAALQQIRQAYGDAGCFFQERSTSRFVWWPELGLFFFIWTSSDLPDEIRNRAGEIGINRPRAAPSGPGNRPCSELG